MRRPFDQAHRIPFGLQQCRQIPLQARIRHRCLLPPTPGLADPPLRSDSFSREFFDPSLDRLPIRSRARCYLTDTTRADLERFCSQIQAPLLLIQFVPQDLVLLLCRHSLTIPYFPVFWKLFADEPLDDVVAQIYRDIREMRRERIARREPIDANLIKDKLEMIVWDYNDRIGLEIYYFVKYSYAWYV